MTWNTCGSEAAGRLNIEHVHCVLKQKTAGAEAGGNFQCPYFPSPHLPCNGSVIYNNARRGLCERLGHFYTPHPLTAQRRDFYKPLYVCKVGRYRRRKQLPDMTIIPVGRTEKQHHRERLLCFLCFSLISPIIKPLINSPVH